MVNLANDFIDVQELLLKIADHNIQTLTETTLLQFPADELAELCDRHSAIAVALWRESLYEASIMREWVANIGRRNARSRTAHLLCEIAVRCDAAGLGGPPTFELPMTQEQLGDALGLTAVHVNRTLKALEGDGLIVRSKRAVTVADWNGLREAGDFSTNYLHLDERAPAFV